MEDNKLHFRHLIHRKGKNITQAENKTSASDFNMALKLPEMLNMSKYIIHEYLVNLAYI